MQRIRVPTIPVLKSRWLALVLSAGLLAFAVLRSLGHDGAALWSLIAVMIASVPGLQWPNLTLGVYRAWDRLSRLGRRVARLWLTGVVFVSIGIIGLLGSRLPRARPRPGESGWTRREPVIAGSYTGEADIAYRRGTPDGWVRRYTVWAWRSGNLWSWSLLPALALLKVVEGESRGSLGGDVYTLY